MNGDGVSPKPPSPRDQARLLRSLGFIAAEEVHGETSDPAPLAVPPSPPQETASVPPKRPARKTTATAAPPAPVAPAPELGGRALTGPERMEVLAGIAEEIASCRKCNLCSARTRTVPGEGNPTAQLLFVGEGPGQEEDRTGRPFVGAAGELLTKIITAMGLRREDVYIANVVKCRPPGNRVPEPEEMAHCLPYLSRQIEVLRPSIIVCLGATALRGLLPETTGTGISKLRGRWLEFHGIRVMPTFHPAYLLRNPANKRPVWEDMQLVMAELGLPTRRPGGEV